MASPSRDARNAAAVSLLNYGFSNYALYRDSVSAGESISVVNGVSDTCPTIKEEFVAVVPKTEAALIEKSQELPDSINAPVKTGQQIGRVVYKINGKEIGSARIVTAESVKKMNFFDVFIRIIAKMTLK
jgi:D-alanyl-D-alanine carboxypeptidase (penicillin-binding protein 5/6)